MKNIEVIPIKLKEGIPIENITNKDDKIDEYICTICKNFAIEPSILSCGCNSIYCKNCAYTSYKYNRICPMCKKNNISIIRSKKLDNIMDFYKLKCLNKKCLKVIKYSDYLNHIKICPENVYKCLNEGCNETNNLINMKEHSNICIYRPVKCKYCQLILLQKDFDNHLEKLCKAQVQCPKCQESFERGFYNTKHFSQNDENVICLKARINKMGLRFNCYREKMEKKIKDLSKSLEKTNLEKKELIKSITNLKGNFKDYLEMSFNNLITKFDKEDDNKKNVRKIKGRNYEEGEKIGRYNTARNSPSKMSKFNE